jgi:Zn-dependent protease with chaperone function
VTAGVLAVLAVVLAGPVPAGLARLPAFRRTPVAAVIVWQAVALAAVLAAVGAGLALATDRAWREDPGPLSAVVVLVAAGVAATVVVRLLACGHLVGTRIRARRRRFRSHVDLLAHRDRERPGVLVVEHDAPVAYCLPAMAASRVFVSTGTIRLLSSAELDAVIAHERAHVRGRHDLVLEAFSVIQRAFPRWVASRAALDEVSVLVEVLADRAAVRRHGSDPVAHALVALAAGDGTSTAAEGVGLDLRGSGRTALARVGLLGRASRPVRDAVQSAALVTAAAALLVLPTVLVVRPWLASLAG